MASEKCAPSSSRFLFQPGQPQSVLRSLKNLNVRLVHQISHWGSPLNRVTCTVLNIAGDLDLFRVPRYRAALGAFIFLSVNEGILGSGGRAIGLKNIYIHLNNRGMELGSISCYETGLCPKQALVVLI